MNRSLVLSILGTAFFAASAFSQAKDLILFVGDGASLSSFHAASIYGYGKPQAIYVQKMPHLDLADVSSARQWVTDAAACVSAWATGHKTRNGVMSMSPDAERDVKDGEVYKTVSNTQKRKVSQPASFRTTTRPEFPAPSSTHINTRDKSREIFEQMISDESKPLAAMI